MRPVAWILIFSAVAGGAYVLLSRPEPPAPVVAPEGEAVSEARPRSVREPEVPRGTTVASTAREAPVAPIAPTAPTGENDADDGPPDARAPSDLARLLADDDLCGLLAAQDLLKATSAQGLLALLDAAGGSGSPGDELSIRILRSASGPRASRALKELKAYGDVDADFLRALLLAKLFESTSDHPKDDARGKIPDYRQASSILGTLSKAERGNAALPLFRAVVAGVDPAGRAMLEPELTKAFGRKRFRTPWRRLVERAAARGRAGTAYFLIADEAMARVARPDYERALNLIVPLIENRSPALASGAVELARRTLEGKALRGSLAAEMERAFVRELGVAGWKRLQAEGEEPLPDFLSERPRAVESEEGAWIGPITLFERLAEWDRARDPERACNPDEAETVVRKEWKAYGESWGE